MVNDRSVHPTAGRFPVAAVSPSFPLQSRMSILLERDMSLAASAIPRKAAGSFLREVVEYGLGAFEQCKEEMRLIVSSF